MALTTGQKMALYLLLSSRSRFRFDLERQNAGVANPFPDAAAFAAALKAAIGNLNIGVTAADLNAIKQDHPMVTGLFRLNRHHAGVPNFQVGSVTTNHNEIITALDLPPLYTEDNPCPDGGQQTTVAQAIAASLP